MAPTLVRGHQRSDTALIFGLSSSEVDTLSATAQFAKANAYCPYSKFRVGAAVLLSNGECIAGANVENAAYPVGTCAERVGLGAAVAGGARRGDIKAMAVSTDITPPASPCGMCRQFMREFCPPAMPVLMYGGDGRFTFMTMEQLLPNSFGPEDLNGDDKGGSGRGTGLGSDSIPG